VDGLNELLMRYFRDGDAAAMEEIVSRTRGKLLAAARRIGSRQDAEDSVQATYHALLRRGDRPLDSPLIAWLLTVVVRIAYRRKAIDQRQAELARRLALPNAEAGPLRQAEHTEHGELLRAEVARLPAKYRDALVLRYFAGLSRAECAALLDVPEDTVKTRLRRGRELLRGRLNPRLRHALLVAPWFLSDTAWSATTLGVVMKSKAVVVLALLALLGLVAVVSDVFRTDRVEPTPRAAPPPVREASKPEPTPDGSKGEQSSLVESFDLAAADRDRDVHGIVVAEDGSPVAGATLSLVQHPWRRANTLNADAYQAELPGPSTRSARDGSFVMPWKRGNAGEIRIEADGFARRWLDQVQAGERVRIVMDTGATVNMSTVDPDGAALAGVQLVLRGTVGREAEPWAFRATSDAAGHARIANVAGNRLMWIQARHPDHGRPGWLRVHVPKGGESVDVEVRMRKRRLVTGRVTDQETGEPIEGARIGLHWSQRDAVRTDANGQFEIALWQAAGTGTGAGTVTVAASADGFAAEQALLGVRDVIDFVLARGDRVRGVVIDAGGRALGGVRVAALGTVIDEQNWTSRAYAETAPDGKFAIEGLRHDTAHTFVFMAAGYARTLVDCSPAERAGGTIDAGDVVLRPGRRIEGRVLDAEGEPLPRVPVTLTGANSDRIRIGTRGRRSIGMHGEQEMRMTDDLGRFRFPDLAPGSYRIAASRPRRSDVDRTVGLAADADQLDVEIRFGSTRELSLHVVDSNGAGVADAFYMVKHEGGAHGGRTDADGRARLRVTGIVELVQLNHVVGLPDDVAYELPVQREKLGREVDTLRLQLKRAGVVHGIVLLPGGKPLYKPLIEVHQGERTFRPVYGNEDGTFRAEVPRNGSTELVFAGGGVRGKRSLDSNMPYAGKLEGVAAGSKGLVLRLRPLADDRTVTVRVVDPDGKPMPRMRVFTPSHRRFVETDADGRVTLKDMLARPTKVHVFPDARNAPGLVPPAGVEIVPNGQEIEIRFRKGVALRGIVVRRQGSKGNIFVVVSSGKTTVGTANCDDDGRFEVFLDPDVGDGPFRIRAVEAARRDPRAPLNEIEGVMLDGPEPRIEMK